MDEKWLIVALVAIVCLLVFGLGSTFLKNKQIEKFALALNRKEYDLALKICESVLMKILFPAYNVAYMRLNVLLAQSDQKKIDAQFDTMLKAKLNSKQKEDLSLKAFNYYISIADYKKAKSMLDILDTCAGDNVKRETHIMYDIFALKKFDYISEMEKQFNEAKAEERNILAYLLSVQYENKKDTKKALEYKKIYKK